ncbi:hypothetical protein [Lysobacter capsici]|uniref:hypothetical protein n=1 Tax=Lysobacter capsici TaxID=435897 RepID=UPI0004453539|nr:hypothetical protein [Lysobacter capsici]
MKTSFADSVIVSTVVSAVGLAVTLLIVVFELSLIWSPLILVASIGAFLILDKISKRP